MLILDDPEVHAYLQVCMLIDESAFTRALCFKYRHLHENILGEGYELKRIVRENVEKFFLFHLRLPALSDDEIVGVMENFVRQLQRENVSVDEDTLKRDGAVASPDLSASPPVSGEPIPSQASIDIVRKVPVWSSVIEPHEARALLECVKSDLCGTQREVVGPRALRCMLFRYQIARDILQKLNEEPNPHELAKAIVTEYCQPASAQLATSPPNRIQLVVKQLS
jgi:hypothetical protein